MSLDVKRWRWTWIGHVSRMPLTSIPVMPMWRTPGKYRRQPGQIWRRSVEHQMKAFEWTRSSWQNWQQTNSNDVPQYRVRDTQRGLRQRDIKTHYKNKGIVESRPANMKLFLVQMDQSLRNQNTDEPYLTEYTDLDIIRTLTFTSLLHSPWPLSPTLTLTFL